MPYVKVFDFFPLVTREGGISIQTDINILRLRIEAQNISKIIYEKRFFFLQVEINWEKKPYFNVISNETLSRVFEQNAAAIGVEFDSEEICNKNVST